MKILDVHFENLADIFRQTGYNGVYALVDENSILSVKEYGFADFQKQIPFTADTRTCLGSLTKQFIGFSFAKLCEEGKIDFEATLDIYFPEYIHAKEVKIWQMLHMTSGIPDYTEIEAEEFIKNHSDLSEEEADYQINQGLGKDFTVDEVIRLINNEEILFLPGKEFRYSNTNYLLLGEIIQKLTGQAYSDYLQQNILVPLEMRDTFCSTLTATAQSYRWVDGKCPVYRLTEHKAADGSMVTTLEDMIKWTQAILQGKILSNESWDMIFDLSQGGYGLGWFDLAGWHYHGGQILGYHSEIFIRREERCAIIMLYNLTLKEEQDKVNWNQRSEWMRKWLKEVK